MSESTSPPAADAPAPESPAPESPPRRNWALHIGLFVLTCASTYLVGGQGFGGGKSSDAFIFAGTLMAILLTHEMGHFIVARRHGIRASLPYFIPIPFALGTLGAIIKMDAPIQKRNALIDVGAAGPLAGLLVAIPLLIIGLATSPLEHVVFEPGKVALVEGNSLLYIALKFLVKGRYLPYDGWDVQLGPMAMAAWVGLLLTFINLLPIGQLDGGHIAHAFFGNRHEQRAPWLHRALIGVGLAVFCALGLEAWQLGRSLGDAAAYGGQSAMPWLMWALILLGMRRLTRGRYHPPVGDEPLSPRRRVLFWIVAVVFVLLFTPVPFRELLSP